MTVDVHSHFLPVELAEYLAACKDEQTGVNAVLQDGVWQIKTNSGFAFPLVPEYYDYEKRVVDMDKARIDKSVLSISPLFFFYDTDPKIALEICQLCNDWAFRFALEHSERFDSMARVPMQDIDLAIQEMDRAHRELGMQAVEIAPVINGEMLDDPKFFPFYQYCEEHGILLYLHPALVDRRPPYDKYHAMNLMGYVQETNWALVRMLFGGVFEQFPGLKVLTSHAGGQFPYQFGRLMHGHEVRQEAKIHVTKPLTNYLKNIYFDTITHWTPALQFLVDNFGADHVLMGTDYPYDMADSRPVDSVEALKLTSSERSMILAGNTCGLLSKK